MELNSYLEQLEEQIRNRKAKAEVIEEIRNHIEDQAEFYEKEGMSAEEAIEQAVRQMGDPVEVGIEMDRIHRPKPGAPLFLLAFMMSVAGLLTQYFSFYRFGEELVVYQRVIDNAFARQCVYVLSWGPQLCLSSSAWTTARWADMGKKWEPCCWRDCLLSACQRLAILAVIPT